LSGRSETISDNFEEEDLSSSFEFEESDEDLVAGTPQARVATANRIVNFPNIMLIHN